MTGNSTSVKLYWYHEYCNNKQGVAIVRNMAHCPNTSTSYHGFCASIGKSCQICHQTYGLLTIKWLYTFYSRQNCDTFSWLKSRDHT